MSEEPIQLSDYQISEQISGVSYFDGDQRQLVKAALSILSKKNRLDYESVKEMLKYLDRADLISSGGVESVLRRLFKK